MAMIDQFATYIDTVYFSWLNMPSGRAALADHRGYIDWAAQAQMEKDLCSLKSMGIRLNLLFNGNCYGEHAVSNYLQNKVISVLEHLTSIGAEADIVTTCSPALASMVKKAFPNVLVRASVNMRIGTVAGMEHLADFFDEYTIQRECNRDFGQISTLSEWAKQNGKGLVLLANSGCFNFCSAQTFHDNLVSHEKGVCERDNVPDWSLPNCRRLLRDRRNWRYIMQGSWVRPEDIPHYLPHFKVIKLATRMHENPWMVLYAYTKMVYHGALTDLLEPGFSKELSPLVLANHLLPKDWFEKTTRCDKCCHLCNYCEQALDTALVEAQQFFM